MKIILTLISLALFSTSYGEDKIPPMAKNNLKLLKDFDRQESLKIVNAWPEKFAVPIKKKGKRVVNNLKDHHALVAAIPKGFMANCKAGSTVALDGWYVTSSRS